jgi:DNA-binding NarL/FixJ family response regulator
VPDAPEPITFTPRQLQIVELLARGCCAVEIAEQLGISARTVKAHCDLLRDKLGVRRREIPYAYRRVTGRDPLSQA